MKQTLVSFAVALSLAVPAAAFACDGEGHAAAAPKKVTVSELAKLQAAKTVRTVDANSDDFRAKNGVIPGSILLTSSSSFVPEKELGADKTQKLVFYCASTMCGASHMAAARALEAGYADVAVLPDGLTGWKKAGQKTVTPKPNS